MTDADRITALERELSDTRQAAVEIIVAMARGIASSPEGRAELAADFEAMADESEGAAAAGLARAVADAIRRG